jgi:hypothetical protein
MPSGGTDVYGEKLKERSIQKTPTATDHYSKVTPSEEISNIPKLDTYYGNSQPLTRAQEKEKETAHRSQCDAAEKVWIKIAEEKKFDEVRAPLSVYDLSGAKVSSDPRRTDEYKQKILTALGYDKYDKAKHGVGLTPDDFAAVQDVLWRKAAAFWMDGEAWTTLRCLLHDCIPTGPPVRTPPHKLGPDEAQWVDSELQDGVDTGLLERRISPWGSPPFATKAFPDHRRQRKRRLVVDYRRVNARTLRAVYHIRAADGIIAEATSIRDACDSCTQRFFSS